MLLITMQSKDKIEEKNSLNKVGYRLCPKCGNFSHIEEEQNFCIACGEELIGECPNCRQAIIYPTAKFCFKCGREYKINT